MKTINSYVVAIPAYNEEATILQTLNSVYTASLNTTAKLDRIIVCVNGCTDKTEKLVRAWDKAPLDVIESKPGLVNAMNRLIRHARKHYANSAFIKVDGDANIDADAFKYIFAQLDKHPNLMVSGGHPYPVINQSLPAWRRFVSKVTSVRGRVPLAEVAVNDVTKYHQYTDSDPLPGIGERENRLKIYFHGRLWCMRTSSIVPLLPKDVIGEDVFLPGWVFQNFGTASVRIDYRAKTYFHPNDSLTRHWKVYRRIFEDRHRVYTNFGFDDYAANCPLKLDWKYILTRGPKREIIYFVCYTLLSNIERYTFQKVAYRDSYWQYKEKEV
jgi:glycosyltransferase involved in cell wall biosynthesis